MRYRLYRAGMWITWAVGLLAMLAADNETFTSVKNALYVLAILCTLVWIKCTFEVADIIQKERNRNGS